jgi:hypothetical protein
MVDLQFTTQLQQQYWYLRRVLFRTTTGLTTKSVMKKKQNGKEARS